MELQNSITPPELAYTSVAQHTRPARTLKAIANTKKALDVKPAIGRPRTKVDTPALYHHWLNALVWCDIRWAGLEAGWQMKPAAIVKALKQQDLYTFNGIALTTVREWINFSGD